MLQQFLSTAMIDASVRFLQEWASPLTLVNYLLLALVPQYLGLLAERWFLLRRPTPRKICTIKPFPDAFPFVPPVIASPPNPARYRTRIAASLRSSQGRCYLRHCERSAAVHAAGSHGLRHFVRNDGTCSWKAKRGNPAVKGMGRHASACPEPVEGLAMTFRGGCSSLGRACLLPGIGRALLGGVAQKVMGLSGHLVLILHA